MDNEHFDDEGRFHGDVGPMHLIFEPPDDILTIISDVGEGLLQKILTAVREEYGDLVTVERTVNMFGSDLIIVRPILRVEGGGE